MEIRPERWALECQTWIEALKADGAEVHRELFRSGAIDALRRLNHLATLAHLARPASGRPKSARRRGPRR